MRLISFASAFVLILAGFCYMGWYQAAIYRRGIENEYQKAFGELVDSVVAIDTALQKSGYVQSPTLLASLTAEISRRVYGAQQNIGALPYSFVELENTARFLTQTGEYIYFINKQTARGVPPSEEQVSEIRRLSETATQISMSLSRLMTVAREEDFNIGRLMAETGNGGHRGGLGGPEQIIRETESHLDGLTENNGSLSERVNARESVFLMDKPFLDRKEAAARAAEYLDVQPALMQPIGETDGNLPAYLFRTVVDGGEISVAITMQGGYCLSFTDSRVIGDPKISFDEAVKKAGKYLESQGYDGMKDIYYTRSGNMLLVNFAYKFDNIIYYPDVIKVGVALDNGKICLFESSGYLMNHTYRQLSTQGILINHAMRALSDGLSVSNAELCVISSDGSNEILCYAFTCIDSENRTYIIYVNVETGEEEKIVMLIEDENGAIVV